MKNSMIRTVVAMLVASMFLFCCSKGTEIPERPKDTTALSSSALSDKEMEAIKKEMKSDIRIKLKKDGKRGYGWEITGRDPYEVVKANNIIKNRLNSDARE